MKRKLTHNNLIQRKIFTLVAVALLLLITLASCSNASPPVYTVTFNANGGTIDGEASVQVIGGTAVKEPSDPVRTGYSFDGWRIEGQSETYDFSTPVNSDLTLVAKWTRLNYKVTFNANGGTINGEQSIQSEVEEGTAVKEPSDPVRTGYLFDGWCIEGESETYDFSTPVNSDLTLEAKWTRIYYKVTFKADGGTFSGDDSISVASGDTVSIPTASPTKERYRFDGWYVEGASEAYNFSTPVNSNLTLVAKWTLSECIVTFKLDGGSFSGEGTVTVDVGKSVNKPSAPTKTGFLFAGWFEEGSDTYYDFSTPVNGDLTLVAMWTDENTLSFALDNTAGGYIVSQGTTAPSGLLAIPDTYLEQPVVAIDSVAFTSNNGITAVTIPSRVETIGSSAFDSCASLRTVMFESGSILSEINDGAFSNTAIESIEIPASVTVIGERAFDSCTSLSTVTFESGSKLSNIRGYAFCGTAITSIEIPATVANMAHGVFAGCTNLKTIKIGTENIPSLWNPDWKENCDATVINNKGETIDYYSVTFNANGGTIAGEASLIAEVAEGTTVRKPIDPTQTDYLFVGWFEEGSNTYYDFSTPVNGDLTLVAIWTDKNTLYFAEDILAGGYIVSQGTTAPSGLLAIPDTYLGQPVVAIATDAFRGNNGITAVTIPSSVETIGYNAFDSCTSLRTVMFKSESILSEIGDGAFYNTAIESIEIPASVTIIGESAFEACTSLSSVSFESGSNLYTIDNYAFNEIAITNIEIPASVMDMGDSVFYGCTNLQTIKIGTEAIPYGWNLDWKKYCNATVINNKGEVMGAFTFTQVDGGYSVSQGQITPSGDVVIPDTYEGQTVVAISSDAFSDNPNITAVIIPSSVKSIGSDAFYNCISLSKITFESGSILSTIGNNAFYSTAIESIEIPATVTTMGVEVFSYCNSLLTIKIGTENIPSGWNNSWKDYCNATVYNRKGEVMGAFTFTQVEGGYSVSQSKVPPSGDIVIPDTYEGQPVVAISSYAFYGNNTITAVTIPASVKSIESNAFRNCSSLTTVTFAQGSNLSEMGDFVFSNSAITSIEIPASVTEIPSYTFYNCTSLSTVTFEQGSKLSTIGYRAFWNDSALRSIEIPASVTVINESAFHSCTSLSTVTFGSGSKLGEIWKWAFYDTAITSIEIPASVTVIGESAFDTCTSLSTVTFEPGSKLYTIDIYAFAEIAITSIEIPEAVTNMGSKVFYCCPNLQTIKIGTDTVPVTWDTDWNANCDAKVINSNGQTI